MHFKYIWLIVIFIICLPACESMTGADTNINKKEILGKLSDLDSIEWDLGVIKPLMIGNRWTYLCTAYSTENELEISVEDEMLIDADTIVNGQIWYQYEGRHGDFCERHDETGLYGLSVASEPAVDYLYVKYPMTTTEVYVFDYCRVKLLETDIKISVPAGTFKCYLYRMTESTAEQDVDKIQDCYYKPGLGEVLHETYLYNNVSQDKEYIQINKLTDCTIK